MGTKLLQVRYSVLTAITNVLDISLRETIIISFQLHRLPCRSIDLES